PKEARWGLALFRPVLIIVCGRIGATEGSKACMRELFDEVAGKSPLDPQEAVRRATRAPQRKRFYAGAGVIEADGGFAVALDGKPTRTPSGKIGAAPSRAIAEAMGAERECRKG